MFGTYKKNALTTQLRIIRAIRNIAKYTSYSLGILSGDFRNIVPSI